MFTKLPEASVTNWQLYLTNWLAVKFREIKSRKSRKRENMGFYMESSSLWQELIQHGHDLIQGSSYFELSALALYPSIRKPIHLYNAKNKTMCYFVVFKATLGSTDFQLANC